MLQTIFRVDFLISFPENLHFVLIFRDWKIKPQFIQSNAKVVPFYKYNLQRQKLKDNLEVKNICSDIIH